MPPEEVATLPLVVGLVVADVVERFLRDLGGDGRGDDVRIKWPNDVLAGGRKICGILCERKGDRVIVGIGLNVNQMQFPAELEGRATSLAMELGSDIVDLMDVRDALLERLGAALAEWRQGGFRCVWPQIAQRDFLKGRELSVFRTDGDAAPVKGLCGGIAHSGALMVGGTPVYAGEVHVVV